MPGVSELSSLRWSDIGTPVRSVSRPAEYVSYILVLTVGHEVADSDHSRRDARWFWRWKLRWRRLWWRFRGGFGGGASGGGGSTTDSDISFGTQINAEPIPETLFGEDQSLSS